MEQPRSAKGMSRRLRRAGVATLALLVAAAGVVIVFEASRAPHRAKGNAFRRAGAVPWADRPAPQFHPSPTPKATYPSGPRCGPSALKFVGVRGGAAAGNGTLRVSFRNVSTESCEVRGYPELFAVTEEGAVRSLPAHRGSFFGTPGPVAAAAPGQVISVNMSGSDACMRRPTFKLIRLVLPSGAHVEVSPPPFAGCGLDVSHFGVLTIAQLAQREDVSPLLISAIAPRVTPPSATLRYTISITNNGDTAYSLRPCPSYQEYLVVMAPGTQPVYVHPTFFLNCAMASSIPAHGTTLFAMQMRVPAAVGEAKFGWILNVTGSPAAGTVVEVIAPSP